MRIGVETGDLSPVSFDTGSSQANGAADSVLSALTGLDYAAGDPGLAAAISGLSKDMSSADRAAALTIKSLGKAVANAATMYNLTEHTIVGAESPR